MGITVSGAVAADALRIAGETLAATPQELNRLAGRAVVFTRTVSATLAQINAGHAILPATAGVQYILLGYTLRISGSFDTGTGIALQDSNGTPVVVATVLTASLSDGALLTPASANTTLGAGFAAPLTAGKGLSIIKAGATALTDGASITVTVTYALA